MDSANFNSGNLDNITTSFTVDTPIHAWLKAGFFFTIIGFDDGASWEARLSFNTSNFGEIFSHFSNIFSIIRLNLSRGFGNIEWFFLQNVTKKPAQGPDVQ